MKARLPGSSKTTIGSRNREARTVGRILQRPGTGSKLTPITIVTDVVERMVQNFRQY